jgi:hypothetical protein
MQLLRLSGSRDWAFDEIPKVEAIPRDDLGGGAAADESVIREYPDNDMTCTTNMYSPVWRTFLPSQLLSHADPHGLAHTPKSMIYRKESHR